jgi:hypothetical protein
MEVLRKAQQFFPRGVSRRRSTHRVADVVVVVVAVVSVARVRRTVQVGSIAVEPSDRSCLIMAIGLNLTRVSPEDLKPAHLAKSPVNFGPGLG